MKKNKGFTLIEVLAVIVIIGILALIANPLVQGFIISSRKASYASSASSYLESIKAKMEMGEYGEIESGETMIVPLKHLKLERGLIVESPFAKYDFERSYAIIYPHETKTGPAFRYFINITDESGHAIKEGTFNTLSKDKVEAGKRNRMISLAQIMENGYSIATQGGSTYKFLEIRDVSTSSGVDGAEVYILRVP